MRRSALLGSFLSLLFVAAACEQPITEPASDAATPTIDAVAGNSALAVSAAGLERPMSIALPEGRLTDGELIRVVGEASEAINPGDYQCSQPPLINAYVNAINQVFFEEPAIFEFLYFNVLADIVPTYEALIFLEEDRQNAEYGYDGEFTNQVKRTIKDLRRFSDIDGEIINVVPMKGSMLQDRDRVARTYQSPLVFGLDEATAYFIADQIQLALDASNLLNGGNHPLFAFNAFAFSGGLGIPPKIVMGDATLNMYADFGLGDVAGPAILAHEWAHHVQYQRDYFSDPIPSLDPPANAAEATRYTELMADAWAAYYLTHKRGGTMNQKRVEQFLEVFFQIGDCAFSDPSHHGTPNQRMAAAQWGFDLADSQQKNGMIMSSEQFHDAFVGAYLGFIQPDAP